MSPICQMKMADVGEQFCINYHVKGNLLDSRCCFENKYAAVLLLQTIGNFIKERKQDVLLYRFADIIKSVQTERIWIIVPA